METKALTGQVRSFFYLHLADHLFPWEKALDLAISQEKSAFLCHWASGEQGQSCVKILIVV